MMRGRVQIHAQAVLRLCDGFTGRPVEGSMVRLLLPEGGHYIGKPGGCFVLMNCPGERISVKIESPVYEEDEIELDLTGKGPEGQMPMKTCRLSRGRAMAMPEGTTYVEGSGTWGTRLMAFLKIPGLGMRLLEDYSTEDGQKICIYQGQEQLFEGSLLYIQDKSGAGEFFVVEQTAGEGSYAMETSLKRNYKKAGTVIYQVREGRCGREGYFSIPFSQVPKEGCVCILMDEQGGCWELALNWGERNRR